MTLHASKRSYLVALNSLIAGLFHNNPSLREAHFRYSLVLEPYGGCRNTEHTHVTTGYELTKRRLRNTEHHHHTQIRTFHKHCTTLYQGMFHFRLQGAAIFQRRAERKLAVFLRFLGFSWGENRIFKRYFIEQQWRLRFFSLTTPQNNALYSLTRSHNKRADYGANANLAYRSTQIKHFFIVS